MILDSHVHRCLQTNMLCQEGLGIPPEKWTIDCGVCEVRPKTLETFASIRGCHMEVLSSCEGIGRVIDSTGEKITPELSGLVGLN